VLRGGKAGGFTNKLDERWTLLTLHDGLKIPSLLYFSHKPLRLNICNPQGTGRSLPSLGCCVCNRASAQILQVSIVIVGLPTNNLKYLNNA
jgi:hypothetical protein